jgi:hypothetical protein
VSPTFFFYYRTISSCAYIYLTPIVFSFSFKRNHLGFRGDFFLKEKEKEKEKTSSKWPPDGWNP